MTLTEQEEILKRMDALIKRNATSDPKSFCKKLGISLRTLHRYIQYLKDLGAPIDYSRQRTTYFYFLAGNLNFTQWVEESPKGDSDIKIKKNHKVEVN